MKKDKTEKPQWARLARKPAKASSKDLKKALEELEAEKSQLEKRQGELGNLTIELALNELANEPSLDGKSLAEVRAERSEISERLAVMDRASGLLADAVEKAVKTEKEARLREIKVEIAHLRKTQEADYREGLKRLASAMPYLASAMGGNPGDPLPLFERILRLKGAMGFPFQQNYNAAFAKVKPKKVNASGRIRTLRLEMRDLERKLGVGEFASTGPRKDPNVNTPPRIPVGFTDPPMGSAIKDQGLVAGTPSGGDGEGKFAV